MLKKKKKKDVPEFVESSVSDVPVAPSPPKPKELTEDEKALMAKIEDYKKYTSFITANDTANLPNTVVMAELLNLNFAVFAELTKTNELLERICEDED